MRKTNAAGRTLIETAEGCVLHAYRDGGGVLTIGIGHTGNVKVGQVITKAQAEAYLIADLSHAESFVEKSVKVPLTDNQFAALVSLAFNVGVGAFQKSSLLKKLNAGDYAGAKAQFAVWNKDNGKVVAGLTRRRAAEAALFDRK